MTGVVPPIRRMRSLRKEGMPAKPFALRARSYVVGQLTTAGQSRGERWRLQEQTVDVNRRRVNLTEMVIAGLTRRLNDGTYKPGDKLPTESALCADFGVSRTVIREAVASLRLGGQLVSRQGIGVFAMQNDARSINYETGQTDDIRSAMQILELRLAVEQESVALAAVRRTPEDLAGIVRTFDAFAGLENVSAEDEAKADFEFHLAIASATGNPHFRQFLEAVGQSISLDLRLKHGVAAQSRQAHIKKLSREHATILSAISQKDPKAARKALQHHLEESLMRYRRLLGTDG